MAGGRMAARMGDATMTLYERIHGADAADRSMYEDSLNAFLAAYEASVAPLATIADVETCAYCGTPDGVTYDRPSDLYLCPGHRPDGRVR